MQSLSHRSRKADIELQLQPEESVPLSPGGARGLHFSDAPEQQQPEATANAALVLDAKDVAGRLGFTHDGLARRLVAAAQPPAGLGAQLRPPRRCSACAGRNKSPIHSFADEFCGLQRGSRLGTCVRRTWTRSSRCSHPAPRRAR